MNRIKLIILLFINNIAFAAHDNKYLTSASTDNTMKIFSVHDNREKAADKAKQSESQLGHYLSPITDIPGLQNIIADYLKKWVNVKTITLNQVLDFLAYSPDNKYLASASGNKALKIWDAVTYKLLHNLTGHTRDVTSLSYSPDNKYLASGSMDRTIKIWDVVTYKILQTLIGHTSPVTSVSYSHNNKYLASGSMGSTIKIWQYIVPYSDAKGNQEKADDTAKNNEFNFSESKFGDYLSHVTKISDKQNLIEDYLKQWVNVKTLTDHTGPIMSVAYSPDNKHLASGSADKTIKIWNVNNNYKLLHNLTGHTGYVSSVAYSPDNKYLASGSYDRTIKIWDVNDSYKLLHNLTHYIYSATSIGYSSVQSIAYSSDNKYLASASDDGTINIWDAATYKLLQTLNLNSRVNSISFNQNGKYLASGDVSGNIKIWHHTWLNEGKVNE